MNLPFFKRFNKKVIPLYYLVLILRDEKAQAVILEELEGRVKLVGQKEEHFSTSIDSLSQEELLEKLDKAISQAESSLPENIQTQKTIFGVKESWTENDQIKKDYLVKLKKASEELGLIPIGFLVISQAISHLLQHEEGAPVSAILTEINKKSVTVTLLRAGKSIETKSSDIHESIPFTVDTLLKHFDIPEILPSRIIIFNGKKDLSQEFISHTWSKSLPFLHLPQITNLPHGFDAKAVLFGAATQMGLAIATSNVANAETAQEEDETQDEAEIQNLNDSTDNPVRSVTEDFGFAKDVDVAKMPAPQDSAMQNEVGKSQEPIEENLSVEEEEQEIIPQINTTEAPVSKTSLKGLGGVLTLIKKVLISALGLMFAVVNKMNVKKILSFAPRGKLSIIIPSILILVIALIAGYFLLIKATITIIVDPEIIEQDKSVIFSTTAATDPSENIINGELVFVSEDGSVSTAATGKKAVGDKAKGSITILSSLSGETTIKEDAIVTSSNGLKFVLDSSVKMASSSGLDDLKSNKANVTANDIGKEYNLPSGTKFTIGSFDNSQLVAKNDNPFSGGTKKEVIVASIDDSDKLGEDLLKQLEDKARENLLKQFDQNKVLLPMFIAKTLSKKSLNVKVGDETNQLTLTGTVEYQGISYDKDDLIAFSKSLLSKDIPSNQEIDYNNIKTSVLDIENKDDEEIEANLNIKTLLLPKISESELIKDLKGKSFKAVEDTLYKLPLVADVDIEFSPNLPFLPKNLPTKENNIKIKILING